MMKKTVIIVLIAILSVAAICVGILIAITEPVVETSPADPYTPNSLITTLGIERPSKKIERLVAIRTYQGEIESEDLIKIAKAGGMEFLDLDKESDDYLLVIPFEINGKMQISNVTYDSFNEEYTSSGEAVFSCNNGKELPDNYSLLIRYSRPDEPKYEIKLTQGEQQATYQIVNKEEDGSPVKTTQFIKDDTDAGSESFGTPIKLQDETATIAE